MLAVALVVVAGAPGGLEGGPWGGPWGDPLGGPLGGTAAVAAPAHPARSIAQHPSSAPRLGTVATADDPPEAPDATDTTVRLVVATTGRVDSLDPFRATTREAFEVLGLLYDGLTAAAQDDLAAVPALAARWSPSADGLTWTYTLRRGVHWSDGRPLVADDVVTTFRRIIAGGPEQANFGSVAAAVRSVRAVDDGTVQMRVREPTALMTRLTVPVLPAHVWADLPAGDGESPVAGALGESAQPPPSIGTGPFRLVSWDPGGPVLLAANPEHWAGRPVVDEVELRPYDDEDALVAAMREGGVDIVSGLSPRGYRALAGVAGVTTLAATSTGYDHIAFNTGAATVTGRRLGDGHPAFQDVAFRQALEHAIDRRAINTQLYGGLAQPATTVIPPIYAINHWDPAAQTRGFDLTLANTLLDLAGYERGRNGVRRRPDGSQPLGAVRYLARAGSPVSRQLAPLVREWFGALGIRVRIEVLSEDRLVERVRDGTYEMLDWGWGVAPDPDLALSVYRCNQRTRTSERPDEADGGEGSEDGGGGGEDARSTDGVTLVAGLSDSHYCNPVYDRLHDQQRSITKARQRAAVVQRLQEILYRDVPVIPTVTSVELQAYRSDRWTDVQPQPVPDGPIVFQFGTSTYRLIRQVDATPSAPAGGDVPAATEDAPAGPSTATLVRRMLLGIGALVIVGVAAMLVVARRRSAPFDG